MVFKRERNPGGAERAADHPPARSRVRVVCVCVWLCVCVCVCVCVARRARVVCVLARARFGPCGRARLRARRNPARAPVRKDMTRT